LLFFGLSALFSFYYFPFPSLQTMSASQVEKTAKEVCAAAAVVAVAASGIALMAGLVASHQGNVNSSVTPVQPQPQQPIKCGAPAGYGWYTGPGTDNTTPTKTGTSTTGTSTGVTPFVPASYVGKTLQQLQDAATAAGLRTRLARVDAFGRIIDAACTPTRRVTCSVSIQAKPLVAWTSATAWAFAENNPQSCLVTSVTAC
jgi:hypothetical protein